MLNYCRRPTPAILLSLQSDRDDDDDDDDDNTCHPAITLIYDRDDDDDDNTGYHLYTIIVYLIVYNTLYISTYLQIDQPKTKQQNHGKMSQKRSVNPTRECHLRTLIVSGSDQS